MNFSKGYIVPQKDEIKEGYEIKDKEVTANISCEKIEDLILDFIDGLTEPCFFILELPATQQQEMELRKNDFARFHDNVFYIDGQRREVLIKIMKDYGELLINDGMCKFGFASHISHDEIFIGKYNVVKIYSSNKIMVENLFKKHNIPLTENLKTAWDTFSENSPGDCIAIEIDGLTSYDLVDKLKVLGLYLAEVREI